MDTFDTLYIILGTVAACIGVYMLIAKKLIGRKDPVPQKHEAKFIKLDAITYIVDGLIAVLLGLGSKVPVLDTLPAQFILIAVALAVIFVNYSIGKKITGNK